MDANDDIDPAGEPLITLAEAGRLLPGRRGKVSPATLYRWCKAGYGRTRVVLRTVRVGRALCTRRSWLAEFLRAVTDAQAGRKPPPAATARGRRAEGRAAGKILDRAGVGVRREG